MPLSAIVREGEETAVFVVVGDKAQRKPVTLGLADAGHVEVKSGIAAGDKVIVTGQNGLPDGAAVSVGADEGRGRGREMNVASLAIRQSRAAALVAVALVVAGVIAALTLPSSIYPPLRVPAHRHHRPQRDAAAAVDGADRHAADRAGGDGGPGHPARPVAEHPRRRPKSPRSSIRPPTWSWRCSRCRTASRRSAANCRQDVELTVERLTPAVFPGASS